MSKLFFPLFAAGLASASASVAMAEEAPAPPAGWEAPSPLNTAEAGKDKKNKKLEAAACCKYDDVCCARQSGIDAFEPLTVIRVFEVKLSDMPEAVVKEAPKEGPFIEGAPPVRAIDGGGRPFPWPSGPQGYGINILPAGRYGLIRTTNEWGGRGFFEPMEYRGMGSGEYRDVKEEDKKDKGKRLLTSPLEYVSIGKNDKGQVTIDDVKGRLEGSLEPKATRWIHAETIDVGTGFIHAYRSPYPDEEKGLSETRATFVLPETFDKFQSIDAKQTGGHFPSRFSSTFPYTMFWLPFGPGKSNLVTAEANEFQVNRWFPRPKGVENFGDVRVAIAVSQTSVEAEPRVRVFVLKVKKPISGAEKEAEKKK